MNDKTDPTDEISAADVGRKRRKITAKRILLVALGVMLLGAVVGSALDPNPARAVNLEEGFDLSFKPDQKSIQGRYRITDSTLEYRLPGQEAWHSLSHEVTNTKGWGDEIDTTGVFEERGIKVKVHVEAQPALALKLGGKNIEMRFKASGRYPGIIAGSDDTFDEYGFGLRETAEHTVRLAAGHPDYKAPALAKALKVVTGLSGLIAFALAAFLLVRWLVRRGQRKAGGIVAGAAALVGRAAVGAVVDSLNQPSRD